MGKPHLVKLFDFHTTKRPPIPSSAETTDLEPFLIRTTKRSSILPGLNVKGPTTFTCPKCLNIHREPQHGERFYCSHCKLHMEVYGNLLVFWLE